MKSKDFTKLTRTLVDLDKKAEELDKSVRNVRTKINDFFWDNLELKRKTLMKSRRVK